MELKDWISFAGNVGGAVGGLAAAVALWFTRATVAAARETTQASTYLTMTQTLSLDAQQRRNREILFSLNRETWAQWSEEDRTAARRYLAALNVAAVLDSRKLLPEGLLLEQYYISFAKAWHHAGPWLSAERQHSRTLYQEFVDISVAAKAKCREYQIDVEKSLVVLLGPGTVDQSAP